MMGLAVWCLVLAVGDRPAAQIPSGGLVGMVTDTTGAGIAGASVRIVNVESGWTRELGTSDDGRYIATALTPATYQMVVEARGFRRTERIVRVYVGGRITLDVVMDVGEVTDTVTVVAGSRRDHHQVDGVVAREQIDGVPLNGRSFFELAKLEPGVTSPVRGSNNRTFVSALGSGWPTVPRIGSARVTVDGASIVLLGAIGSALQISQDAVEEFQLATVNFGVATGATTNAAVNIVSRSGGATVRGAGFALFRDHHLSAHPDPLAGPGAADPFFRRVQGGAWLGGPIRRERAFFFAGYERHDQRGIVSVQPSLPEFAPLGGTFRSSATGHLFTLRIDGRLGRRHRWFARYTRDDNRAFAPPGAQLALPSAWARLTNRVDQRLASLTGVSSNAFVHEIRVSYFGLDSSELPAGQEDCPGCFGVDAPRISVPGTGLTFGRGRSVTLRGGRYQVTNAAMWAVGSHQIQAGVDWEHTSYRASLVDGDPAQLTLWSPLQVQIRDPTVPTPASYETVENVLQLPLRSFQTAIGSTANLNRGFLPHRVLDMIHLHVGDTWRAGARLTVNAGLGWIYEPNALNHDLTRPDLLAPILGASRLGPPPVRRANFSPVFGWTWMATRDGRTLVRGGAGRYLDPVSSSNAIHLVTERGYLSPLGTGRFVISGANLLHDGRPIDFRQPTTFTGQHLMDLLPGLRDDLLRSVDPDNRDFSLRNLNRSKEGSNLYDPAYRNPSALHASLGVQREVGRGLSVTADVVYKRFINTFVNGIDYNRFHSASGPVIPRCTAEQRLDDRAHCSNGPMFFDTTIGRARYRGLLARVEWRLPGAGRVLASYAFGSYVGTNGTATGTVESTGGRATGFNNDDWFENHGPMPSDLRHVLNVSGTVSLPWRVEIGFSLSAHSAPPFTVFVSGLDFNEDGTANDLLPGTQVNQFGRGLGKDDLVRLVDAYNRDYANRVFDVGGTLVRATALTLPSSYAFNDGFFTQDVRVSRRFSVARTDSSLLLFAEVFNLFNSDNLAGYAGDISNPVTFGRPGGGFSQVFGSGGPRAVQLGARLMF